LPFLLTRCKDLIIGETPKQCLHRVSSTMILRLHVLVCRRCHGTTLLCAVDKIERRGLLQFIVVIVFVVPIVVRDKVVAHFQGRSPHQRSVSVWDGKVCHVVHRAIVPTDGFVQVHSDPITHPYHGAPPLTNFQLTSLSQHRVRHRIGIVIGHTLVQSSGCGRIIGRGSSLSFQSTLVLLPLMLGRMALQGKGGILLHLL
jgi:hypothetical protein